jgi:hypothetical protein
MSDTGHLTRFTRPLVVACRIAVPSEAATRDRESRTPIQFDGGIMAENAPTSLSQVQQTDAVPAGEIRQPQPLCCCEDAIKSAVGL